MLIATLIVCKGEREIRGTHYAHETVLLPARYLKFGCLSPLISPSRVNFDEFSPLSYEHEDSIHLFVFSVPLCVALDIRL